MDSLEEAKDMSYEPVVSIITETDLHWPFDENEHPRFFLPWGWQGETVDPFPAYAHSPEVVIRTLNHVHECFPARTPITTLLLPRECQTRSNGYSDRHFNLYEGDQAPEPIWDAAIVLSAKRIPPHPAMTRYLVAHEWGHHVQWWLEHRRGLEQGTIAEEYRKLRGLTHISGTGGRWHNAATEIFACDFRLIVAGVEMEFWPHHDVPRPEGLHDVITWWKEAVA
jgi:hypothetical protein